MRSSGISLSQQIAELNNFGIGFYEKGDYAVAETIFVEATSMRHQSILNLAVRFLPQQLYQNSSESMSTKEKREPPSTSYIYQRMDFDEGMGNAYCKAERLNYDGDHPVAVEATLLFNVAQARRMRQDYEGAWSYYKRALKILIPNKIFSTTATSGSIFALQKPTFSVLLTVHRIVIPVLHNMGLLAYLQGNPMEAAAYYEIALTHGSALIGCHSICVGITLNCLGVLHYHSTTSSNATSQDYPAATVISEQYFHQALTILRAALGPDSPAVATTLNNLGRVMVQRDDFRAALLYYDCALKIRRDQLGTENIDYAATAFNAGQSLHQLGDCNRAILLYKEFLRVATVNFSRNHRDSKSTTTAALALQSTNMRVNMLHSRRGTFRDCPDLSGTQAVQ